MAEAESDDSRHRAKVYCLNSNGQWDDRGTGHAAVQYSPEDEAAFVVVVSEDDGSQVLLQARVHMEDIYQRQQETIVSWNEPETGVDYALSFQDVRASPDASTRTATLSAWPIDSLALGAGPSITCGAVNQAEGCTDLWEQICSLQGREPDGAGGTSDAEGASSTAGSAGADTALQLPAAELRNVAAIADLLSEVPPFRRARLVELLLQSDYVPQLVRVFGVAEDLECTDDLHHLYGVFKGLVLLNDASLYEQLLREDLVMSVFGALEYDPDLHVARAEHRAFFRSQQRFKQVVPITDEDVLKRIHQNYHLSFLKDVVLPRSLDDNAFAALNQIAFSNNMQIVSSLANDETFLQSLRDKLADPSLSSEALHDALRLLQELTTIAKQLQLYNRSTFYRKFVEHACFAPLAAALRRPEPEIRLCALEVLLASTQHEPALLRTCILSQRPGYELCHALIGVLVSPGGTGEKPQASEVLRALLDPDAMEGRERDEFLNLFYDEFVDKVAQPVAGKVSAGTGPLNGPTNGTSGARGGEGGAGSAEGDDPAEEAAGDVLSARQHVCELLCFFVTRHTYRIKYFILRNNVLCRVLRLAKVRDKGLVLAAIRFFRTCIGLKDEFYNRYIVKNRCFEPVVAQLLANLGRDNLVHSAILELLEFVRRENVRSLVAHLADAYGERFRTLKHVEVFEGLLRRDAQNNDPGAIGPAKGPAAGGPGASSCAVGAPPGGRRVFGGDEEDAYFNESDDEEEAEPSADAVDDRQFVPRPVHAAADDRMERGAFSHEAPPPRLVPGGSLAPRLPAVLEIARRGGASSPPLVPPVGSPPNRSPPQLSSAPPLGSPPAASPAVGPPLPPDVPPHERPCAAAGTASLVPAYADEDGADAERPADAEALARKRQRLDPSPAEGEEQQQQQQRQQQQQQRQQQQQ